MVQRGRGRQLRLVERGEEWARTVRGTRCGGAPRALREHHHGQVHLRENTRATMESKLNNHIYPAFEKRQLNSIKRSHIVSFIEDLSGKLKPNSVKSVADVLRAILLAAVKDQLLHESPYVDIKLPEVVTKRVDPMSNEEVEAFAEIMPARYTGLIVAGAGCGLRIGELSGLTDDRTDFLRRQLQVDRQLVWPRSKGGAPRFGPPKTKAGNRVLPMPEFVVHGLARHFELFPPEEVDVSGVKAKLLFTDDKGRGGIRYSRIWQIWNEAAKKLKSERTFHDLRHHYASLLIAEGCDVLVVASALGDADIEVVKNTYLHLWPNSDDRVRSAVDRVWAPTTALNSAELVHS
ncbi:MAG TPA: site-specific integrase [Acidimicrobiales bacterium]|nr:site-specific integrase [Acidimicrobiales bacterium]